MSDTGVRVAVDDGLHAMRSGLGTNPGSPWLEARSLGAKILLENLGHLPDAVRAAARAEGLEQV